MNEPPLWVIEYPDDARRLQESTWAERGQFYWSPPRATGSPAAEEPNAAADRGGG
jgi:hypothetical protein